MQPFVNATDTLLTALIAALPVVLPLLAWRVRHRVSAADGLVAGGLFVLAAGLRASAPPAMHDVRSRVVEAWLGRPAVGFDHGLGPVAFVRALRLWLPLPPDELLGMHASVGLGALTVAALYGWLRGLGQARGWAAAAALVLALWGIDVRYGHTDAPQVAENAATMLGVLLCAAHLRQPHLGLSLAGGVLLGLATTMRPEAMLLPLLLLPVLAADPAGRAGWRDPRTWAGVAALLAVAAPHAAGLIAGNWGTILNASGLTEPSLGLVDFGWRHLVVASPAFSHPVLAALALMGLVVGRAPVAVRMALAVLVLGGASLVANAEWSPAGIVSPGLVRHQLRTLPWLAALMGFALDRLARVLPSGALGWLPGVLLGGAVLSTTGQAWAPWTTHQEYAFVREHLPEIPSDCTIVSPAPYPDLGLQPPAWRSELLGLNHRWVDRDAPLPAEGCVVWWRPAVCSTADVVAGKGQWEPFPHCTTWEAAHTLEPLATTVLAPHVWMVERYATEAVRVGFYRLVR